MSSAFSAAFLAIIVVLTCVSPLLSLYLFVLVSPLGMFNDLLGWDPRVRWAVVLFARGIWETWSTGMSYSPRIAGRIFILFAIFAAGGLWISASDLLPDQLASAHSFLLYLCAGTAALFAIWQLIRTRQQLERLVYSFSVAVVLAASIGGMQAVVAYRAADPSGRIAGPLGNPNYFATYLAVAATSVALLTRSGLIHRRYGIFVCVSGAITCVLTLSRVGIVATLVGISLALVLQWDRRVLSWRVLGIVSAVMLVGAGLLTTYVLQIRQGITYSEDSPSQSFEAVQAAEDLSRFEALRYSLQLTAEHPIAGVGFGTFQDRNYLNNGLYVTTHNTIMEVLVGTGVAGAILLVLFIAAVIRPLSLPARRFLCPAAAAFGLCALFGDYLQSPELFVAFAVLYLAARYSIGDDKTLSSAGIA